MPKTYVLDTKDIIVRLKSQMLEIPTEDFIAEQSPVFQDQYTGRTEVYVPDEKTNGLSYASEKMKGSPLCFQLTMFADECLRSALAFDATQRM